MGKSGKSKGSQGSKSKSGKSNERVVVKTIYKYVDAGEQDDWKEKGKRKGKGKGKGTGKRKGKGKSKGKGKRAASLSSDFWERKVEDEDRKAVGSKVFTGTIQRYNLRHGYGFITPDNPAGLPKSVSTALKKAAEAATEAGREVADASALYFRKPDVNHTEGFKLAEGTACTFECYVDNKGGGACEVTMA